MSVREGAAAHFPGRHTPNVVISDYDASREMHGYAHFHCQLLEYIEWRYDLLGQQLARHIHGVRWHSHADCLWTSAVHFAVQRQQH